MLKDLVQRFVEVLSPTPVVKPLNLRVPSQSERILALVRYEYARAQQSQEVESFEDADDFSLDDGEEWFSPYEEVYEPQAEPPASSPPLPPGDSAPPSPAPIVGEG